MSDLDAVKMTNKEQFTNPARRVKCGLGWRSLLHNSELKFKLKFDLSPIDTSGY